jgi:hypothetical protein
MPRSTRRQVLVEYEIGEGEIPNTADWAAFKGMLNQLERSHSPRGSLGSVRVTSVLELTQSGIRRVPTLLFLDEEVSQAHADS